MANNLLISYDLNSPGRNNYDVVVQKIKELGSWAKVEYSFWYVKSDFTAAEARDYILPSLNANDTLFVADTTNNSAAWTTTIEPTVSAHMRDRWWQ